MQTKISVPSDPGFFPLPKARLDIFAASFGCLFVFTFVVLAVINLVRFGDGGFCGLTSSALWLVLVGGYIGAKWRDDGWRNLMVGMLSGFASTRFAQIEGDGDARTLSFACRFMGRRLDVLRVRLSGVESVWWSMGQASGMLGRDANDWSVKVSYQPAAALTPHTGWERKDEAQGCKSLHVINGPDGRKAAVASLGLSVIEFLRIHGVVLSEDLARSGFIGGTEFNRP